MATKRKSYTAKELQSKQIKALRKICLQIQAPFRGLGRHQVIENILAKQQGKKAPTPSKIVSTTQSAIVGEGNGRLTPAIRHFCFLYASNIYPKKLVEWGKIFKVKATTIRAWLRWPEVTELIEKFQANRESRLVEIFQRGEEEAVAELLRMVKDPKNSEVKRKAIVDFLGYAGRKDTNRARVVIGQMQGQQQGQSQASVNQLESMTEEDLDKKLKDLEGHLKE